MKILRGYRYRLYPEPIVEARLKGWEATQRYVWNVALNQRLKRLEIYGHGGSYKAVHNLDQQAELKAARAYDERMQDVPNRAQQAILRDLDAAWRLWAHRGLDWMLRDWKKLRLRRYYKIYGKKRSGPEKPKQPKKKPKTKPKGMPRFKHSRDAVGMTVYVGSGADFALTRRLSEPVGGFSTITLPKLGEVCLRLHRLPVGIVKSVSIVRDGPEWYVTLLCETHIADPGRSLLPSVAIDRGVALTLCDSNGRQAYMPPRVHRLARRIDRLQAQNDHRLKNLMAKQPRSQNWKKEAEKIAKAHRHIARLRRYWLHAQALWYAEHYGVVVVEALNVQGMTASARGDDENPGSHVAQKSGLNRSILEQGWSAFLSMLAYKLEERGGVLMAVPAPYSSQTCAQCGHVDAESRHGRDFRCTLCGHHAHADVNAAQVLLQRHERGESVQIGGYGWEKTPKKKVPRVKGKKKVQAPISEIALDNPVCSC